MKAARGVALVLLVAACSSVPEKRPGGYYKNDGPGAKPPPNLASIPDAVPRSEALNRFANKPYQALGKNYVPFTSVRPYQERGVASWYGKQFHGQKTSSGELYDMYAMSAAHPLLPIPSYARVTNLANGRSVVVRINDRGPFHAGRVIDLSYVAAAKLGYIDRGQAEVEVRAIVPLTHRVRFALLSFLFLCAAAQAAAPRPPAIIGKAWVVGDLTSGQVLAGQRADERVEPASLTKLMTAYVVFTALREGKLALGQQVKVSARAWKQPGSRMFIEPSIPVTVDELIRGMEVHSGNDACVALAEALAGSEETFAEAMNREAARLGMKDSHFVNATGLPNARHYSTAADLYRLAAALIADFPAEYAQYYALKEFRYKAISQPNRNRLLWLDPSVDGVKTGHTESAGWCLIASSKRGGRRLLSVVLGTPSDATRTQESLKLLNWGFQLFDNARLYGAADVVKALPVWKGAQSEVKVGTGKDLYVTVPKGEEDRIKAELVSQQPLVAPLAKGDRVGTLRVSFEGRPYVEAPVFALEPVAPAGFFKRAWDTLRLWLK